MGIRGKLWRISCSLHLGRSISIDWQHCACVAFLYYCSLGMWLRPLNRHASCILTKEQAASAKY